MFLTTRFLLLLLSSVQFSQETFLGFIDEEVLRHELDEHIPDVSIDAGEIIELTCAAAQAEVIAWKYPHMEENSTAVTETSRHTTNSDGERVTPYYTSKLIITNATHRDTGEYECYCNGMDKIEHFYQVHIGRKLISKRNVYVYVKDSNKLFTGEPTAEREPITGISRGVAILPCAVTHPNMSVQLIREKGYNGQQVIPVDGKKYQFDPKTGFIISLLSVRDSGTYSCVASVDPHYEEIKQFYLHVMISQPLLEKPELKGPTSIALGMSATFRCHVAAGKEQLTAITWWKRVNGIDVQVEESSRISIEDPLISESMCSGNRSMCSFKRHLLNSEDFQNDSLYIRLTGRMKMREVTPVEAGKYLCKAWSAGLSLSSDIKDLQVTSPALIKPTGGVLEPTPAYDVEIA